MSYPESYDQHQLSKQQEKLSQKFREEYVPEILHGWEDPQAEGGYVYPCRSCGEDAPIMCDPCEFLPDNHYCGRSPRCCP